MPEHSWPRSLGFVAASVLVQNPKWFSSSVLQCKLSPVGTTYSLWLACCNANHPGFWVPPLTFGRSRGGGLGHVEKRRNQSSSVSVHSAVSHPFSKPFLFYLRRMKFLCLDQGAGWLGNNPLVTKSRASSISHAERFCERHWPTFPCENAHAAGSPWLHFWSGPPRQRRGNWNLIVVFWHSGSAAGAPRAPCSYRRFGQCRDSLHLLTVNTSHVPGHKGGRCKSPDSSDCWAETYHQTDRVSHKSLLVFCLPWMTLLMTTICFSIKEAWVHSFLLAK